MNFRLTLFLAIVVIGVAAIFAIAWMRPAGTAAAGPGQRVLSTPPKQVTALSIKQQGAPPIELKQQDGQWQMTAPVAAPADEDKVSMLAGQLANLSYEKQLTAGSAGQPTLEQLGLQPPRIAVTLTGSDGKTYELNLGKQTPAGRGLYVQPAGAGQTVYLAKETVDTQIPREANKLRSRTLATVPEGQAREIAINRGDTTIVLRNDKGTWNIVKPLTARADETKINDMLQALHDLKAESFTTARRAEEDTGLARPREVLTVSYAPADDGAATPAATTQAASQAASQPAGRPALKTATVYLGAYADLTDSTAYAGIPERDEAYIINGATYKILDAPLQKLRDPAVTRAPVNAATKLVLKRDGQDVYELTHEKTAWRLHLGAPAAGTTIEANASAVQKLLKNIADLRAIQFADNVGDPRAIGLKPAYEQLLVTMPGGTTLTLNIGKTEAAQPVTPMQPADEPTVYMVQAADAKGVAPPPQELRGTSVADYQPAEITSLNLAGPAVIEASKLAHAGGATWDLTQTTGSKTAADATKTQTLLGELDPITAQKWLTTPAPTGAPRATLTITAAPAPAATGPAIRQAGPQQPETSTLRLWHEESGWVATLEAPQAQPVWPFEPTQALVDALTHTTYAAAATQPAPK